MINLVVLKMEIKRSLKGLIAWTLSIAIFMYLVIILYPMVKDVYASIPQEYQSIMESFGGIPKNIIEYFATESGMPLQIFGSIFAAMIGFNSINREERDRATDILYTLPVSRTSFFTTKLISVFIQVIVFVIVNYLTTILGFISINSLSSLRDLTFFFGLYSILLIIISVLGFSLACLLKGYTKSTISLLIPFPFYILSIISTLSNNEYLKKLKHITPFTFSDPVLILKNNGNFELINFLLFSVITLIVFIFSLIYFNKKEF